MISIQVSGPSGQMTWIREGPKCLDARNITEAIDNRYILMLKFVSKFELYVLHFVDAIFMLHKKNRV